MIVLTIIRCHTEPERHLGIMERPHFWKAVSLTAALHLTLLGGLGAATWLWVSAPFAAPELVAPYGDSDVIGLPLAAVAVEAGTLEKGTENTVGGDDQPQPLAFEPEEARPLPPALPAISVPGEGSADSKPDGGDTTTAGVSKPMGMAGGSQLPLGTPTKGGRLGVVTGARLAGALVGPTYPAEAQVNGWTGIPKIWAVISAEGKVLEVKLKESSGYAVLDQAALRWMPTQRYRPAMHDGVAVEATVIQPVRFYFP